MLSVKTKVLFAALAAALISSGCGKKKDAADYVMAASSAGTASTVWIIDAAHNRIIFCRQSSPNSTGDDLTLFSCRPSPF